MDDNPFSKKLGRLISSTLKARLVDGGIRHVMSYRSDYWPIWPAAVFSFLQKGKIIRRQHGVEQEGIFEAPAYLVMPENVSHHSQILSSDGATFVWCHIHFHIMESFDLLSLLKQPIALKEPKKIMRAGKINHQLVKMIKKSKECPITLARCHSLIYTLLSFALEDNEFRSDTNHLFDASEKLSPLIQQIHKRFQERWTIEQMTQIACLSRSRLHSIFKELYGKPPLDYVTSLRLRQAQTYLLKTDMPIGEIAEKVGYEDSLYFSRRFSSAIGVSPSMYRDAARED